MAAKEREFPACTFCLFCSALICHTVVLIGNLETAGMLSDLGQSAGGWSSVGSSISYALTNELNPAMEKVSEGLTKAVELTTQIQEGMDSMLSVTGSSLDAALQQFQNSSNPDLVRFKADVLAFTQLVASRTMAKVTELVSKLMEVLRPALEQIKEWLATFGEKIQDYLDEFGTTIDRVQKIFDQVMSKISTTTGKNEQVMLNLTYDLFDTDNSGQLRLDDFQTSSTIYGISALAGEKAEQLLKKYDPDGDGVIDKNEYAKLVHDDSLPGIMTVVVRTYASKLSMIAGRTALAGLRDEVADAVVDYMGLVCAQNITKVRLVAERLVSNSLPIQFLADIYYQLMMNMDDPTDLTVIDVGQLIVNMTVQLDGPRVVEALTLLSSPDFWEKEGFNGPDQPRILKQLTIWIVNSPRGLETLKQGLAVKSDVSESLPDAVFRLAKARQSHFAATHRSNSAANALSLYRSNASQALRTVLLGGVSCAAQGFDPDAIAAIGKGQPAQPQTLSFARELATNASTAALELSKECFEYSAMSSGALESVANSLSGMIKKTQSFLSLMKKYAGPHGIERLEDEAFNFGNKTIIDLMEVTKQYVDTELDVIKCQMGNLTICAKAKAEKDLPLELSGATTFLTSTLRDLKSALPVVVGNLKTARKEVSIVAGSINGVMEVLGLKGQPLFELLASMYTTIWISYFVFFFLFTSAMCLYGFWASGYFGGPKMGSSSSDYVAPQTFRDRLCTCWTSCLACVRSCREGHFCFWSVLLLTQAIVLLLFVISLLVCIITGVQAFMNVGCSKIYLLGDDTICSTSLKTVKFFLKTFGFSEDIGLTCQTKRLLTCALIRDQVARSGLFTGIGSILASTFSFEMLLDSAVKHERARLHKQLEGEEVKTE